MLLNFQTLARKVRNTCWFPFTIASPGNYVQRQVERWSKQYRASATKNIPSMEDLMQWLPMHTPHTDRTSVVHGDFRLDNLIFDPTSSSVKAVLDWELSTLGDPISDLAYCCMAYHLDPDSASLKGDLLIN